MRNSRVEGVPMVHSASGVLLMPEAVFFPSHWTSSPSLKNPILQATAKASSTFGPTSHLCDRTASLGDRASSSHPFVPSGRGTSLKRHLASRRTLYSSPGRPPNQTGGTDSKSRHDPRRVGPLRNACASHVSFLLRRFNLVLLVPAAKPLPADFGQLAGRCYPGDLRAGTLADPRMEVPQRNVAADHVHRRLHQHPAKP
jgi:hypothetical protein